jgi:uncharacterized membrane protein
MAEREREVIVTDGGRGGGAGFGMLAGIILVLAVLAVLFFVFKDQILGGNAPRDVNVKIETPSTN